MGRLIDVDRAISVAKQTCTLHDTLIIKSFLERELTVEAIPKDQYEARLKADLKAILVELQLEIEELKNEPACCQHYKRGVNRSSNIIQQRINELEEEHDPTPQI